MPEPNEEPAAQPSPASGRPHRRWLQISLRTLLLVIALVAVAALAASWYEAPFRRQREAMAAIEKAGGTYQASPAGPAWLRRLFGEDSFRNVTLVNVADCDEPGAYLDQVAGLPALETLVVGGLAFTDEHLRRLHGLTTLTGLVLDCTQMTDDGLSALRSALPSVEIYPSERRAIVALSKLGAKPTTKTNFDHPGLEKRVGRQWFDEAENLIVYSSRGNPVPFHDADLALVGKLAHLRILMLDGVQITDAGLEHVRGMKQLHSLILQRLPGVSDPGLAHLEGLTDLIQLGLAWTNVSDAGLSSLRGMTRLVDLALGGSRVTDAGLAQLEAMTQLSSLHLSETEVGDAGLAHLKELPIMTIRLNDTQVGDAGLAHLSRLKALRILELNRTKVTDAGMDHLAGLGELVFLQVEHTKVGDKGLAKLKGLNLLEDLRLEGTRVTDVGMAHIASLSELTHLYLGQTQVTDAGAKHLHHLKNLGDLILPRTVSSAAVRELQRAVPNCRIQQ